MPDNTQPTTERFEVEPGLAVRPEEGVMTEAVIERVVAFTENEKVLFRFMLNRQDEPARPDVIKAFVPTDASPEWTYLSYMRKVRKQPGLADALETVGVSNAELSYFFKSSISANHQDLIDELLFRDMLFSEREEILRKYLHGRPGQQVNLSELWALIDGSDSIKKEAVKNFVKKIKANPHTGVLETLGDPARRAYRFFPPGLSAKEIEEIASPIKPFYNPEEEQIVRQLQDNIDTPQLANQLRLFLKGSANNQRRKFGYALAKMRRDPNLGGMLRHLGGGAARSYWLASEVLVAEVVPAKIKKSSLAEGELKKYGLSRVAAVSLDTIRTKGDCKNGNLADFFPDEDDFEAIERAKAICRTCHLIEGCLEYAVAAPEPYGIWGGADEKERKELRRARRAGSITTPVVIN